MRPFFHYLIVVVFLFLFLQFLGTELVAAVAVGTIIGFILDSWFDTKPWLIIIFFFLGAAAGMLNVIRAAKQMQKED